MHLERLAKNMVRTDGLRQNGMMGMDPMLLRASERIMYTTTPQIVVILKGAQRGNQADNQRLKKGIVSSQSQK